MLNLIQGTFVHTPALNKLEILEDYLLGIWDPFGTIKHFAPSNSPESVALLERYTPRIIPRGNFILPTFCDLHLHAPQFLYQGNGLHLPLMQWLNEYAFKAEERMDNDAKLAQKVYTRLAQRLKENGTGAVMLFGTIKEETNLILAKCMNDAGLRAFVGKLSMDQLSSPDYIEESAKASIEAAKSFAFKMQCKYPALPDTVEPVITPRFVPTCSDALLDGLGRYATACGLRIQSHLAESHDQVSAVLTERGVDDIEVFARSSLLTPKTVQAHCTFLDGPSLGRLQATGTAVAHCPLSNAYFSAEPFKLREALDMSVKVGLGTDVAGGYSLSIMDAMRQAVAVSRMRQGANVMNKSSETSLAIDWVEALYLATKGGADALGIESGVFEIGRAFDAQQIALWDQSGGIGPLDFFDEGARISPDIVEKWWCLGDARNRLGMWIQGKERI
ncbi:Metallo-dependent hydrolase [Cylindrobasidium torrendii FP15055 ss-10]|uniref:Metallo-dependent hydrolase n=1 Tax=Cylindrobasidium torrendii FP15055 ss-10 TaxID=1314674 RepID=A0A0D7BFC8_9AGAR|nr:Metallo-dependent hydrolase [Cylindrobasidium torrendii FP15055 ss-10]